MCIGGGEAGESLFAQGRAETRSGGWRINAETDAHRRGGEKLIPGDWSAGLNT